MISSHLIRDRWSERKEGKKLRKKLLCSTAVYSSLNLSMACNHQKSQFFALHWQTILLIIFNEIKLENPYKSLNQPDKMTPSNL